MTEPTSARPVPGPPRPGPVPGDRPRPAAEPSPTETDPRSQAASFDDLEQRPLTEHVAVFEAEHARLQGELGTIDQL